MFISVLHQYCKRDYYEPSPLKQILIAANKERQNSLLLNMLLEMMVAYTQMLQTTLFIAVILGIEILASALLMADIRTVVYPK